MPKFCPYGWLPLRNGYSLEESPGPDPAGERLINLAGVWSCSSGAGHRTHPQSEVYHRLLPYNLLSQGTQGRYNARLTTRRTGVTITSEVVRQTTLLVDFIVDNVSLR